MFIGECEKMVFKLNEKNRIYIAEKMTNLHEK